MLDNSYWLCPTEEIPEDSIEGYKVVGPDMTETLGYVYVLKVSDCFNLQVSRQDIGTKRISTFNERSEIHSKLKYGAEALRRS